MTGERFDEELATGLWDMAALLAPFEEVTPRIDISRGAPNAIADFVRLVDNETRIEIARISADGLVLLRAEPELSQSMHAQVRRHSGEFSSAVTLTDRDSVEQTAQFVKDVAGIHRGDYPR